MSSFSGSQRVVASLAAATHRSATFGLPDAEHSVRELDQHIAIELEAGTQPGRLSMTVLAGFFRIAWSRLTDGVTTAVPGALTLVAVGLSGFTASHDPRPVGSAVALHWMLAVGCLAAAMVLFRSPNVIPTGPLWSTAVVVGGAASLTEGIIVDATFETDWALKFCAIVAGLALLASSIPRADVFANAMRVLGIGAFGAGLACLGTLSYGYDAEELVNVLVSSGSTMVGAWAAFRLQDLPPASDETVGGPVIDVRDRPAELQTAADRRQPETTEQRSSVSLVAVAYGGRSELAPGN